MARRYPRLRVTRAVECGGWHVSSIFGPDAGPAPMCHHDSWPAAMRCASQTAIMLALLPRIEVR
ncbi:MULTISPECIES: hypothetical protein [Tsukamurella]|uniref:Uncharacterized protein n=2 Tax=Tsukamurella TaxID=2060 RepID=A0A5C5S7C4_9ACTN|nr:MULTISPECIES: hypothetical protein [Tsukamurella]NMD55220.1 hypothetical protein [Tsukamurella columbiensis]TWS30241.1 hypothetical protein FK530_06965 [Tsukamurella conjunctivitidis]